MKKLRTKILSARERENTTASFGGVIYLLFASAPAFLHLKWEAQTRSSRSRFPPVPAPANAVHFGTDVKACAQDDPGLPATENSQRQVRKSMRGATAGPATKGEGPPAVLFLQPCTASARCFNSFYLVTNGFSFAYFPACFWPLTVPFNSAMKAEITVAVSSRATYAFALRRHFFCELFPFVTYPFNPTCTAGNTQRKFRGRYYCGH